VSNVRYRILPEYTDDQIDAQTAGRNDRWAMAQRALRTVPPEWRQSIVAASNAVAFRDVVRWEGGLGWINSEPTGVELNDAIVAKVGEFHAGVLPPRVETVEAETGE
jgi:hypothetical protein